MEAAAFDVVTSDVLMPGGDGRTLLDAVVERGLTVPVVMVTADIQRTTREDCIRRGAFAVVDKPVKPDLLLKAVDEALVRRISPVNPVLTTEQTESLAELVNMGVGRAAAALNDLVGGHVELTVPVGLRARASRGRTGARETRRVGRSPPSRWASRGASRGARSWSSPSERPEARGAADRRRAAGR